MRISVGESLGQFLWENDEQSGSGSLGRPTHVANLRIINITISVSHIHQLISEQAPCGANFCFDSYGLTNLYNLYFMRTKLFPSHEIDCCAKHYPLPGRPDEILQTEEADSRKHHPTIVNARQIDKLLQMSSSVTTITNVIKCHNHYKHHTNYCKCHTIVQSIKIDVSRGILFVCFHFRIVVHQKCHTLFSLEIKSKLCILFLGSCP